VSDTVILQIQVGERLATLEVQVKDLKGGQIDIRDTFVSKARFAPVEKLVYGVSGSILTLLLTSWQTILDVIVRAP